MEGERDGGREQREIVDFSLSVNGKDKNIKSHQLYISVWVLRHSTRGK